MHLVKNHLRLVTIACALVLGTAASAAAYSWWSPAGSDIVPFWKPYSQRQADWWKWLLAQPADVSPLLDTTGAHCNQGQAGDTFFLAGTTGAAGLSVTRACSIPANKVVLIPIVNEAWLGFPTDEDQSEAFVRAQNTLSAQAKNLKLEIDGVKFGSLLFPMPKLTESTLFDTVLPAGNLFGSDYDGQVISVAADKGRYYAVRLGKGTHKIYFHAEAPGNYQDVTYNVTVQ
jgi:hypothetical protein